MLDLTSIVDVVQSISPRVIATDTTTTGTTADLSGYNSAVVVFDIGTVTDGTYTPVVQESTDGGDNWGAVDSADLEGTLVAVTTSNDPKVQQVGYKGSAGLIRAAITSASTSSGGPMSASIVLGHKRRDGATILIS